AEGSARSSGSRHAVVSGVPRCSRSRAERPSPTRTTSPSSTRSVRSSACSLSRRIHLRLCDRGRGVRRERGWTLPRAAAHMLASAGWQWLRARVIVRRGLLRSLALLLPLLVGPSGGLGCASSCADAVDETPVPVREGTRDG